MTHAQTNIQDSVRLNHDKQTYSQAIERKSEKAIAGTANITSMAQGNAWARAEAENRAWNSCAAVGSF